MRSDARSTAPPTPNGGERHSHGTGVRRGIGKSGGGRGGGADVIQGYTMLLLLLLLLLMMMMIVHV
jgi:hypothetical protein